MLPDSFFSGNTVGLDPEEVVQPASAGWMVEASRSRSLMTTVVFVFVFRCAIFQGYLWKARPPQILAHSILFDFLKLIKQVLSFLNNPFSYIFLA